MGRFYLEEFQKSGRYEVAYICDLSEASRQLAHQLSPESQITDNENIGFDDPSVQAVARCALANSRKEQIEHALNRGKHVISEKPIADTVDR